jgi:Transposase DDE domain/Insertion element 4 transposase N-terminal
MPSTPFFSSFQSLLFGRPPRSATDALRRSFHQLNSFSQLQEAFGSFIPDKLLSTTSKGSNSRERFFTPRVTFWAFLAQVLCPNCPCREVVRKVQAWCQPLRARGSSAISSGTGGYCQARARLSQRTLESIHESITARLQRNVTGSDQWRGRDVYIVDGTNLSMPDTPANQALYPQSSGQKPGCGFPMLKLVALFSLASGALLHVARGSLHMNEVILFRQLWSHLKAGCLILADRGFCSYFDVASLFNRGVDSVMRLRNAKTLDLRRGKRLGSGDRLVTWQRPQRTQQQPLMEFDALPLSLNLRQVHFRIQIAGSRTREVVLITTLLDPLEYPAAELALLYLRRWGVELHFREIKTILRLDVLRCMSPEMIHKELCLHLIAYNMVRVLMQEASHIHHVDLRRLSFKGTLDTLRHFADAMHAAKKAPRKQASLLAEMLAIIAKDRLPLRPNRAEPRAKKRRSKNYHLLTKPRHQMRVKGHRNRPQKSSQTRLN